MSSDAPTQIGPYKASRRLDGAGDVPVYEAVDGRGRKVAVKLWPAGEPDDLRAFRLEAIGAAASLKHPAMVQYREGGEFDGRVFAAMELFPSSTLRAALKARRLPLHGTLRIVRQVAEATAYLHRQGKAHGCLNPTRVLVSRAADQAKIIEPGMGTETRRVSTGATATLDVVMSARYVAPELARSDTVADPRSDVYSIGVLFYEALTGKVPEAKFRLPSQEADDVPPQLDEVVLRCLRRDPAARYANGAELAAAIDRIQQDVPGALADQFENLTTTARGMIGGETRGSSGMKWALIAALGGAALIAAFFAWRALA